MYLFYKLASLTLVESLNIKEFLRLFGLFYNRQWFEVKHFASECYVPAISSILGDKPIHKETVRKKLDEFPK